MFADASLLACMNHYHGINDQAMQVDPTLMYYYDHIHHGYVIPIYVCVLTVFSFPCSVGRGRALNLSHDGPLPMMGPHGFEKHSIVFLRNTALF